jgi:transcriptional regulator with XRE-family HTH domain
MTGGNDHRDTPENSRGDVRGDVRTQIRQFLTTRRSRITPEQAGLPVYRTDRRRVSGLRREEVALLAGISSEYYIRLERGNATGISESVIDGLAHALQLDEAERQHLLDLLATASTTRQPRRQPARHRVRPTVQRVLDSMHGTPAFVLSGRLDVLAANELGRALFAPVYADPVTPPNTARFIFLDPQATEFFRDWDKAANDTVALLRAEAGRDPYDRQTSDLIGELSTRSEEFRHRWGTHDVQIHTTGVKLIHHPVVGDLDLAFESFPMGAGTSQSLLTYTPEPGSPTHDALTLLASWAASTTHETHSSGQPNDQQDRHGEQGHHLPSGPNPRPDNG